MENNIFKTGAVMDIVAAAKKIDGSTEYADTQSIEDAAIKNKIANMPHRQRTIVREYKKIGRNEPCPCGSGKKYKNCCLSSGKYEQQHELTVLESAKIKNNEMNLSDISKKA